ncbi:MAG: hypothetical protein ACHQ1H_02755 [Nitrososphaerales archaeon]
MSSQDLHKEGAGPDFQYEQWSRQTDHESEQAGARIRDFGTALVSGGDLSTIPELVPLVLVLDLLTVVDGHGARIRTCATNSRIREITVFLC